MSAPEADNEWAAGVMGWTLKEEPRRAGHYWQTPSGPRPIKWNPDTDANDFRELLNCEAVRKKLTVAVREHLAVIAIVGEDFPHEEPIPDQPAALRRLRSAMEADGKV